jgi:hypothetical protein
MTGQIPPYARTYGFAKVREDYAPGWNHARYQLKADPSYRIKAESGSKRWHVYHGAAEWPTVYPSLTEAMKAVIRWLEFRDKEAAR